MRSFQLYPGKPLPPPRRLVTDMSPKEQADLREAFRSAALRYRRHGHVVGFIVLGAIGVVSLGFILPRRFFSWIMGGFITCWLAGLIAMALSPGLRCPGCRRKIDDGYGQFCPECGVRALEPRGWPQVPRCSSCQRALDWHKRRGYQIRACTHCGLWLDDKGL